MKILVTGSAGFIGFHLSKALLERGDTVFGLDNYSDYYDVSIKKDRTKILKENNNFSEAVCDISDFGSLKKVFEKNKFDVVVNLAAQAGVRYSLEKPGVYENTNIKGFLNVLECCRHIGPKRLVYASSSSVYGANKKLPFSEEDSVDNPISLYAASKKSNELMAFTYNHLFGIKSSGLRFFTVYGPMGRPDMALFLFTKAISEGKPINVFNNGEMERDFTYVDDIVSGLIASIDTPFEYEIFNLGRGESRKLTDFIKLIEKNLGKKADVNMLPIQPGDVPKTFSDVSKAKEKLGYSPKTSIEGGIKKFVDWYKEYYKIS